MLPLAKDDRDYLLSRGYTNQLIEQEDWFTLLAGNHTKLEVVTTEPLLAVASKTPAGTVTAIQLVNPRKKEYKRFKSVAGNYLPIYFASDDDFQRLEQTQSVILTEGMFDRIAIKRGIDSAVFALLGLGLSAKMERFILRYVKRVWLALDMDERGIQAAGMMERKLSAEGLDVGILRYPTKDPSDWLKRDGLTKMRQKLDYDAEVRGWVL